MLDAADEVTMQVMVRVALPLGAIEAIVQVPVPVTPGAIVPKLKIPIDGVNVQFESPAGRVSTTENVFNAIGSGPAFETASVYVSGAPMTAGSGVSVLVRLRSVIRAYV